MNSLSTGANQSKNCSSGRRNHVSFIGLQAVEATEVCPKEILRIILPSLRWKPGYIASMPFAASTSPELQVSGLTLTPSRALTIPAVILVLFGVELSLGAMYIASFWLAHFGLFRTTTGVWDLDLESNPGTWFSASQLLAVGVIWGAIAWARFEPRRFGWWSLVAAAAMFAFLSLDEEGRIHDRLGEIFDVLIVQRKSSELHRTGVWVFVLAPILIAGAAAVFAWAWPYLRVDRLGVVLAVVGFGYFLFSACGLEIVSNYLTDGRAEHVEVLFEEVGEMVGTTLVLWGSGRIARKLGVGIPRVQGSPTAAPLTR